MILRMSQYVFFCENANERVDLEVTYFQANPCGKRCVVLYPQLEV